MSSLHNTRALCASAVNALFTSGSAGFWGSAMNQLERFVISLGLCFILGGCSSPAPHADFSLPVTEIEPGENQLLHYPADQATVRVNPPGMVWTRHPGAQRYRLLMFRGEDRIIPCLQGDSTPSTVAPLSDVLQPGSYAWFVVYEDSEGHSFGRSRTREFSLEQDAAMLPMPDVAQLRDSLKGRRPRIFLTAEHLETIRSSLSSGQALSWGQFESRVKLALKEPPYPEPSGYKDGVWTTPEWRRIYTPAKTGTAHMVRFALAWKLTGDPVYLERAKAWLMNFAAWNPRGIASHDVPQPDGTEGNDEASMPILERMSIVYDWIHEALSEEQRVLVRASITERGNQVMAVLKQQDFLSNPFENHEGRVLAFLGLAGLAFVDEIPDAEAWLDYVLRCYLTSFPVWGSDEGEWAQGLSYWSAYVLWATEFAEATRGVTSTDIYRRPFFRNTGYLPVYFLPPYAKRGAFGDGGEAGPGPSQALLIQRFAVAFHDPVLLWQAREIPAPEESALSITLPASGWNEWFMEDVQALLDTGPSDLLPRPPVDLPASRFLPNVGWAAAHSALGNADDDVWLLFKSSRFGSFSHSHADQNSFQLNAFGEPLLIDSGYYPWYGSPHHTLWTRQTRAHNAILVNGRGQPVYSMAARGRIEYCEQVGEVIKMRGEAAEAYNVEPSKEESDLWLETFKAPHPPVDPMVRVATRTLAFVAEKAQPWVAIQDYLQVDGTAKFQYLLHAVNEMALYAKEGKVSACSGNACVDVYIVAESPLDFAQTSKFTVAPEERFSGAPEQFHFSAETVDARPEMRFLAVLVPYRRGETPPIVEPFEGPSVRGFHVGGDSVEAWWGPGQDGILGGASTPARMRLESGPADRRRITSCE